MLKPLKEGAIKSVLVVDDDDGLCRCAVRQLKPRRVHTAARIAEAMQIAEAEPLDLAIVDVHLCDFRNGGENGLVLVRQLHTRDQSLPIVVITGFRTGITVDDAYQAGAVKTYEKPFTWETIIRDMEIDGAPNVPSSVQIPTYPQWKREYLARLLASLRYNITHAAQKMGVTRWALQRMLAKLGVERDSRRA